MVASFYYQHVQEQQAVKAGEQTIEGFIDSLNQENYEEAVKSLQVEKGSDFTEQDILEKYQNIYGAKRDQRDQTLRLIRDKERE